MQTQLTIHIKVTLNNTLFTITNALGNTLFWMSSGSIGYKGAKRASPAAAEATGIKVGTSLSTYHCNEIHVHLNGIGPGRISSIKGLKKSGITILTIKDVTPIAHNGCRPPKKRRL
jgi:small subunit ribosomal protein S11